MANFIKQSTQQKEKRRNKERGPKSESEEQNPKWVTKGAKEQNNLHNCGRGESEAVID
jgi:replication initiation and membrane attachment protein DnaB